MPIALSARVVASAGYAAVLTMLAVLAGLFGSVYQAEIAKAFPLSLLAPFAGSLWVAVFFWAIVALLGLMFFLRQRVDDVDRRRLADAASKAEAGTARIEEATKRLQHFLETLPPRSFQTKYSEVAKVIYENADEVMPRTLRVDADANTVALAIRGTLHMLCLLALQYDDEPLVGQERAVYAGNVMVLVPQTDFTAKLTATDVPLRFVSKEFDRTHLSGALLLRPDLSSTSAVPGTEPDASARPFALPVPKEAKRKDRWMVLPGAPKAFLQNEPDGYSDTLTIREWCERNGDFQPSTIDELDAYFRSGAGRDIRSFISIPIGRAPGGGHLGVVNLHANRTNILGPNVEKQAIFAILAAPFFAELDSLLSGLLAVEGAPGHSDGVAPSGGGA